MQHDGHIERLRAPIGDPAPGSTLLANSCASPCPEGRGVRPTEPRSWQQRAQGDDEQSDDVSWHSLRAFQLRVTLRQPIDEQHLGRRSQPAGAAEHLRRRAYRLPAPAGRARTRQRDERDRLAVFDP
jgi:predicted nucleic acid-binding Zn ribbon protein